MHSPANERFVEALSHHRACMLITPREDVGIDARPMTIAEVEHDGTVWMFTDKDTTVVAQLDQSVSAAITAQSMTTQVFASGLIEVLDDTAKARELWTEPLRIWFPDGPETEGLRLIRLAPKRAELWSMTATDVVSFAFDAAKAWVTGDRVGSRQQGERASLTF